MKETAEKKNLDLNIELDEIENCRCCGGKKIKKCCIKRARYVFQKIKPLLESDLEMYHNSLPDETTQGEPFWVLMEIKENINTGNIYIIPNVDDKIGVPLFRDRSLAEIARRQVLKRSVDTEYKVMGVSRDFMNFILDKGENLDGVQFMVGLRRTPNDEIIFARISAKDVKEIVNKTASTENYWWNMYAKAQ